MLSAIFLFSLIPVKYYQIYQIILNISVNPVLHKNYNFDFTFFF